MPSWWWWFQLYSQGTGQLQDWKGWKKNWDRTTLELKKTYFTLYCLLSIHFQCRTSGSSLSFWVRCLKLLLSLELLTVSNLLWLWLAVGVVGKKIHLACRSKGSVPSPMSVCGWRTCQYDRCYWILHTAGGRGTGSDTRVFIWLGLPAVLFVAFVFLMFLGYFLCGFTQWFRWATDGRSTAVLL